MRIALARLGSGRYIGFDHVEGVLTLARLPEASALSLPGQQARRIGDRIALRRSLPGSFENSFGFRCLYLVRSFSSGKAGWFRPSSGRLLPGWGQTVHVPRPGSAADGRTESVGWR